MTLGLPRRLWVCIAAIGTVAALGVWGVSVLLASPTRPYALARHWPIRQGASGSIAVNPALGRVYVSTEIFTSALVASGEQIETYGLDGQYLGAFLDVPPGGAAGSLAPSDIAVSPTTGDIYGADSTVDANTITKYGPDGTKIGGWSVPDPSEALATFGGIAVAPGGGDVYVTVGYEVLRYTPSGRLVGSWGEIDKPTAHLRSPGGIAIGPGGDVYVNDDFAGAGIDQFRASGAFVRSWPLLKDSIGRHAADAIAVDSASGDVFAGDLGGDVEQFTGTGRRLGVFGDANADTLAVIPGGSAVYLANDLIAHDDVFEYVPGTIPTITRQPARQTVPPGRAATFVAAATGDPNPLVRWERSTTGGRTWHWIPGAVHRTLRLANVTARMNGDRYRAVFSNGVAPVVTRAVELRVT